MYNTTHLNTITSVRGAVAVYANIHHLSCISVTVVTVANHRIRLHKEKTLYETPGTAHGAQYALQTVCLYRYTFCILKLIKPYLRCRFIGFLLRHTSYILPYSATV